MPVRLVLGVTRELGVTPPLRPPLENHQPLSSTLSADDFRAINCEIVATSVDSHFSLLAWTNQCTSQHSSCPPDGADFCNKPDVATPQCFFPLSSARPARREGGLGAMNIPLLSDLSKKISKDYGVLIEDGDDEGVAFRGLFIIDPTGTLRQACARRAMF